MFIDIKCIIIFYLLFLSCISFAQKDSKEPPPSQQPAWVELEMKITELSTKIKTKELKIESLLREKNELPSNSPLVKNLLQQIISEHKDLQKTIDDYDKKRTILKYRHPERGSKIENNYRKIQKKSIEEIEVSAGVEGKLNRNLQRMRSQYNHEKFQEPQGQEIKKERLPPQKQDPSIEEEGAVLLRK